MKKAIITELDYLRVIAFIAVVLQHVLGFYHQHSMFTTRDSILIGILFGLTKYAVPLFIFLSGMVLFYNYGDQLNYPRFIMKRFVTIYIPFVLFSAFYLLFPYKSITDIDWKWIKEFFFHLLYGSGKYHLWYVAMLFQGFLLLPIIFYLFKLIENKLKDKGTIYFSIALLLFSLIYVLYISYYYKIFTHFSLPKVNEFFSMMHSRGFLSYSYYFVLGGIASRYYDKWILFLRKYSLAIGSITLLTYVYVEFFAFKNSKDNIDLSLFSSLNLRFFVFTVFCILFLYWSSLIFTDKYGCVSLIKIISKYSFFAYLVHAYVLNETYYLLISQSMNILVFYFLLFIITVTISIILGLLLQWLYSRILFFTTHLFTVKNNAIG